MAVPLDSLHLNYPLQWKVKKVNWNLFSSFMDENTPKLKTPSKININIDVENFTSLIADTTKMSRNRY